MSETVSHIEARYDVTESSRPFVLIGKYYEDGVFIPTLKFKLSPLLNINDAELYIDQLTRRLSKIECVPYLTAPFNTD